MPKYLFTRTFRKKHFSGGRYYQLPELATGNGTAAKSTNYTVLNPRRKNFPIDDPKAAREQIVWKYHALRDANVSQSSPRLPSLVHRSRRSPFPGTCTGAGTGGRLAVQRRPRPAGNPRRRTLPGRVPQQKGRTFVWEDRIMRVPPPAPSPIPISMDLQVPFKLKRSHALQSLDSAKASLQQHFM